MYVHQESVQLCYLMSMFKEVLVLVRGFCDVQYSRKLYYLPVFLKIVEWCL